HLRRVNSVFYSVLRTSPFGPAGAVLSASLRVARLRLASARLIKLIRGSFNKFGRTLHTLRHVHRTEDDGPKPSVAETQAAGRTKAQRPLNAE
ncbi:MAG: hypothetical protein KKE76_02200, partial [Gammaproteobacteria bacterium]|nr:hypothetical protein [Gammaproteobacteria bacterium]